MKRILFIILITIFYQNMYSNETVVKVKAPEYNSVNVLKSDIGDLVYAGTWGDGMYISSNKGQSFETKNTGLGNLFINDIVFDSKNNTFIATQGDGVYKSTNNGNLWVKLNYSDNQNVTSVYINPNDDNTIYLGTYGSGLFVSTDAGATWENRNRSVDNNGLNIALESMHITSINLTIQGTLLVGTYGDGVYRSEDNGLNWRRANSGTNGTKLINQITSISSDRVLMATNDKGMFESNNDALQWTKYEAPADSIDDDAITCFEFIDGFAVVGTRESGIWFYEPLPTTDWVQSDEDSYGIVDITKLTDGTLLAYDFEYGLLKSTNKGKYWESFSLPTQSLESFVINVGAEFVLHVNNKLFISSNIGDSWQELTNYEGGLLRNLKYQNGKIIGVKDKKVLISENKGQSWTSITNAAALDYIDNVTFDSNGDIYLTMFFNYFSTSMADTVKNQLYKSTNSGSSWTLMKSINGFANKGTHLEINTNNDIYYYPSYGTDPHEILKSTDGGVSFTTAGFSGKKISRLNVAFGSVYVTAINGIFVSKDNGTTFNRMDIDIAKRLGGTIQPENRSELVFNNANDFYVGLSNHWGVYHTKNGGMEWDSLQSGYTTGEIYGMALNSSRDLMFSGKLLYKYLNSSQMGVPQLNTPENSALNQPLELTFDWDSSNKAELYNFQISTNNKFGFSYEDIITSSTEYDIYYKLKPNTTYYWRVRGKTGGIYSNWSNTLSFSTLVGPPNLISPANDTISVPHLTEFEWESVEDAEMYRLYVATDTLLSDIVVKQDSITNTAYTLLELQKLNPLTSYYWAVAVQSEDGSEGQLSETWKFRTILAAPVLTFPDNNSVNQPDSVAFTWDAVEEGVDYQIQISRISDFSQSIFALDAQTNNITQQSLSELAFNAFYYWRVRATDTNKVKGPWSEIWAFKTGQKRPVLISPVNNSGGLPSDVALDWSNIDKYNYWLQVADNPEFQNPLYDQNSLTQSNFDLKDLEKNKTFYWRVRAILNDTLSPWTGAWNFSTGLARTVLILPEDDSEQPDNISILFKWENTEGAEYYQLQVSNNDSFTNLFSDTTGIPTNSRNVPGLISGNTYYWRVKAYADDIGNDWSEVRTFNIKKEVNLSVLSTEISGILIYPNPARDKITLDIPADILSEIQSIVTLSQTGQELNRITIKKNIQNIDISNYANGTYYLILEGKMNRYLFKLNKVN